MECPITSHLTSFYLPQAYKCPAVRMVCGNIRPQSHAVNKAKSISSHTPSERGPFGSRRVCSVRDLCSSSAISRFGSANCGTLHETVRQDYLVTQLSTNDLDVTCLQDVWKMVEGLLGLGKMRCLIARCKAALEDIQ